MIFKINDIETGKYLNERIKTYFPSVRQFCKKYLEIDGREINDEEIRKQANRFSQILKGKKRIQLDDLPIVTEILEISCEELLSAGKVSVPTVSHSTNYIVASSKDPAVWKNHIEREDDLVHECDEYGKCILDYIFEFKNYKFLKFLMDENYIWFVDDNPEVPNLLSPFFGARTNIPRHPGFNKSTFQSQLQTEDQLRTDAIALAIENNDPSVLDKLHAREIPTLHFPYTSVKEYDTRNYYNHNLITAISNSNSEVLNYYSQEFPIETPYEKNRIFTFPFLGDVIDLMLINNSKKVIPILKQALSHNKKTFEQLLINIGTYEQELRKIYKSDSDEHIKNWIQKDLSSMVNLSPSGDILKYQNFKIPNAVVSYTTNIIHISGTSADSATLNLIDETNNWYQKILELKGNH